MANSKNINNYHDIREVADAAIRWLEDNPNETAVYATASPSAAKTFFLRFYAFRQIAQKLEAEKMTLPGYTPPTPYDGLHLKRPTTHEVHISLRRAQGVLRTPVGEEIPFETAEPAPEPRLNLKVEKKDE